MGQDLLEIRDEFEQPHDGILLDNLGVGGVLDLEQLEDEGEDVHGEAVEAVRVQDGVDDVVLLVGWAHHLNLLWTTTDSPAS